MRPKGNVNQAGRFVTVQAAGLEAHGDGANTIAIAFHTVKNTRLQPNTAEVILFNLSREHRDHMTAKFDAARAKALAERYGDNKEPSALEQVLGVSAMDPEKKTVPAGTLRVWIGRTPEERSLLIDADIVEIRHYRSGPTWETHVRAMDGYVPWKYGFVNESIGPGLNPADLMDVLAAAFQATLAEDSERVLLEGLGRFKQNQINGGWVLHGPIKNQVEDLMGSLGLAVSIQDRKIQIIDVLGTTQDFAIELREGTNILGEIERRDGGRLIVTTFASADLRPGRQIKLVDRNGLNIDGGIFRCDEVHQTGETHGPEWSAVCYLRSTAL